MLRGTVLCLLASVTTIFARQDVFPVFSDVFTVQIVNRIYYLDECHTRSGYVWYDGLNNKSREDIYDQQLTLLSPSAKDKYGRAYIVNYLTTENQMNMKSCVTYAGAEKRSIGLLTPFAPFDDTFVLVGREAVNGVNAEKWVGEVMFDNFQYTRYWWVTYKELHGVRQAVPVKYKFILYNMNSRGFENHHLVIDYFDYETGPIDPDIFDIQKGLQCYEERSDHGQKMDHLFTKLQGLGHLGNFMLFRNKNDNYDGKIELSRRREIFKRNLKMIESHNNGDHGYKLGVNYLADRTEDELATIFGGAPSDATSDDELKTDGALPFPYSDAEIEALSKELPEEFDWRIHGGVNPIKDSLCQDAYAFSAVGAVEGALFIKSNRTRLVRLSEQAILDCGWGFNLSCWHGSPELAFEWIKKHGIPKYDDYHNEYRGMESYCYMDEAIPATTISNYVKVKNDTNALKLAIFHHGPVSVRMFVSRRFGLYSSGIYYEPFCPTKLKWLVNPFLVVGWGVLEGRQYWIVRSSWSAHWGIDGYIMVAADKGNLCGILTSAYYVNVK